MKRTCTFLARWAILALLNNYDPIVNDLAQLKQLQTDLQQTPSFVDQESRKELERLLQQHITIWQQKEESILSFQSQNAVLINSLTYFPIAIADIVAISKHSIRLITIDSGFTCCRSCCWWELRLGSY